jgi:chromosomal replication initiator protein
VLPEEVAFFIAKRIRSNVRELEGALRRVIANSRFTGGRSRSSSPRTRCATCCRCRSKLVTIENIQKTVAEYFKVRVADLLSKRRSRSIARQVAALAGHEPQPADGASAAAKDACALTGRPSSTACRMWIIGDASTGRHAITPHGFMLHACTVLTALCNSNNHL